MSTATSAPVAPDVQADVAEIERSIDLIAGDSDVIEIRAPDIPTGNGYTAVGSGYFDREHHHAAAQAAYRLSVDQKAPGVYMTLNPVLPALLARAANRMAMKPKSTTTDAEILRRHWLFIDIDPHRPSGIAATAAEMWAADDLAGIITDKLAAYGFPRPIRADSGNGRYLFYRISEPNDEATTKLIRSFYSGLDAIVPRVNTNQPHAAIDQGVFNAARIARIGGTWNRKGDNTADRPHRLAHYFAPKAGEAIETVAREHIEAVAAMAPTTSTASKNGQHTSTAGKIDVPAYCADYGVEIRDIKQEAGRTIFTLNRCAFNPNHGSKGETSIVQADGGLTTFHCKHNSCGSKTWQDFKAVVGKLEPRHVGKPDRPTTVRTLPTVLEPGTLVKAADRGNFGTVVSDNGNSCTVHFVSPEGQAADVELPKSQLRSQDGQRLDGEQGPIIPPPCSLPELVSTYPTQRPAVIDGLLREGETMNVVAAPKRGKSWLCNGLALAVVGGLTWLDAFRCTQGRVLIIDGELHPEVIAHRLPAVAQAMGIGPECTDLIDVLPLRGLGVDLMQLSPFIDSIEPGRYALIILDAWYRFLPIGFSENDNAQVMALYNRIDGYTSRLRSAWVNVHHASKGDQSGKSTTDVGSGAGSQSRAADTHLIIRQHEQDDVAVIEAVVRSWPPVQPLAIRWTFPVWQLDTQADPRKLQRPRERTNRETRDIHLAEDRQNVVNVMVAASGPQTLSDVRNTSRIGNPRFGFAWASLIEDSTIIPSGSVVKGNNRRYEAFILSQQETDQ